MRKMSLFGFAVLLGAALIFSACEGETTTETNTVLIGYDVLATNEALLQNFLADPSYSKIAYSSTTFPQDTGGSLTIPAGKTLGLFSFIAASGTVAVNGDLYVEVGGSLSVPTPLLEGPGNIRTRVGGEISTNIPVQTLAGLPGFGVDGGKLIYGGGVAGGGSITALLGKVTSGELDVTGAVLSPNEITIITIPSNKKLSVTTSEHAASGGTGPQSLSIPVGLFLTTPGLTNVSNVTINGGGKLIFSGAPGSLSLAAGSTFILNEGGVFEAPYSDGSLGLVLAPGAANGGTISITGVWNAVDGNITITGATNGGTIGATTDGKLQGSVSAGSIVQGTNSLLTLKASTTIDLNGGLILLGGTESEGARIYFTDNTSRVLTGTVSGGVITGGTLTGLEGGSMTSTTIIFGTVSGGTLAYIAGSLSNTGDLLQAGTTDTFVLSSGTVVLPLQ